MSKVRNLPETTMLEDADLIYAVDVSEGPNAGRKATIATLRTAVIAAAQDIPYNNNDSTLDSENVKEALDELDGKVNNHDLRHLPDGTDALNTASAVTITANTFNTEGTTNAFARADHTHNVMAGVVVSQAPDQANAESSTDSFARAGHIHNIPTAAPTTNLSPATLNSQGVGTSFARNDHSHAIDTALVAQITTIQPDDAAAAGTSDTFARGDHKHAIVAAAPTTTLSPATTNDEGVGTSFSRNDHTHAIAVGLDADISTILPDATAATGAIDRFARAGHTHAIACAAASSISTSTTNTEGASTSFARADHTHVVTISNSSATATADDTTTSITDVLIVGMTLTPAAGTYAIIFSTSGLNSANGATRMFFNIYSGGALVTHSEREIGVSGGANSAVHTSAVVTVNGSEAIEARWRAVAGTNTCHERSLIAIKLG